MVKLLALLAGVLLVANSTELLGYQVLLSLGLALWLMAFTIGRNWSQATLLTDAILFCGCGFLLATLSSHNALITVLCHQLDGQRFIISGEVIGLPQSNSRRQKISLQLDSWQAVDVSSTKASGCRLPEHISLALYHGPYGSQIKKPEITLRPGQLISAEVVLKRPRGLLNPTGFDYQAYLLSQGIDATGYVRKLLSVSTRAGPGLRWQLQALLNRSNLNNRRFMAGLLLGDRSNLSQADWQLLQDTGTSHLLAISGLHIGLMALLGFGLGQLLGRLLLLMPQWYLPSKISALLLSLIFVSGYAYLSGFSLPTQRALIMLLLVQGFYCWARPIAITKVFLLALIIILLLDPFASAQLGMTLSFAAVLALLYGFSGRQTWPANNALQKIEAYVASFAKSQLLVMGLSCAVLFSLNLPLSPLAPLANFIAIPLLGLLLLPLLISGLLEQLVFSSDYLWHFCDLLLQGLMWFLSCLQNTKWQPLWPPLAWTSLWAVIFILAFFFLFLPRGLPGRYLFLILPILLFSPGSRLNNQDTLTITVMDVGQGLAVVISKGKRVLVYDTGAYFSADFNAGRHIVAPYLRQLGVERIDTLWVSHSDNDHSGGMDSLLALFPVGELVLEAGHKRRRVESFMPPNNTISSCYAGRTWRWQGLVVTSLWPGKNTVQRKNNNRSCALQLNYGRFSMLLAGDIERQVERQLLPLLKPVDILLAPHHGSKSSSSLAWVKATRPSWMISSAGFKNRYGHPHAIISARYQAAGARLANTAKQGAVKIIINLEGDYHLISSRVERDAFYR